MANGSKVTCPGPFDGDCGNTAVGVGVGFQRLAWLCCLMFVCGCATRLGAGDGSVLVCVIMGCEGGFGIVALCVTNGGRMMLM